MSLPTSLTGFLPHIMDALETQLSVVETTAQGLSLRQQALSRLTASVFAAVISVVDAAAHAALFVIYTPFVAIKEGIQAITGWENFTPEALNASDWMMHIKKIQSSVVIFLNAIVQGWTDPAGLLAIGKRHNLVPIVIASPEKGVPEVAGA